MSPAAPVDVALRGVTVRYGARTAVRDVDLDAHAGEILAVLGPSGCGKTTLLYAINRLHEVHGGGVATGRITIGGVPTTAIHADDLRRRVGLILQRPVPFPMSIRDNVGFALRRSGVRGAALDDRIEASLRRAALWPEVADRLHGSPLALSGGQQQRLCLARALALEPEVLLLDEPCASLDPRSTAAVEQALAALAGTTLVLVTHNLAQARRLAGRWACLWPEPDGARLVDVGPAERVFTSPATDDLGRWFTGAIG